MSLFPRRAAAMAMLLIASATAMPSFAEEGDEQINQRPSGMATFGDAVFARPLLFAITLGGTAAFVASLPFTVLGGNVEEAAKTLVVGPAKSTFTRCLGCTAAQDEWKNKDIAGNTSAN